MGEASQWGLNSIFHQSFFFFWKSCVKCTVTSLAFSYHSYIKHNSPWNLLTVVFMGKGHSSSAALAEQAALHRWFETQQERKGTDSQQD